MVNGKQKGAGFEREICKLLSLWVSGGKQVDLFWRSAMSGGRATVQHAKGVMVRQAGDICAVAPEGQAFCDSWYIECKHVKRLALDQFLVKRTGPLANFWAKLGKESVRHNRQAMLIARQNGWPTLVFVKPLRLPADCLSLLECPTFEITGLDELLCTNYKQWAAEWPS
jgi:hypothetical protein